MDTNVLNAAFRTRAGASFQVFLRLRQGDWCAVLSNHLLLEYEEVLKRHAPELGLSLADVDELLNAICARRSGRCKPAGNPSCAIRMMSRWCNWPGSPGACASSASTAVTCSPPWGWE
jgi:hypothetical protein